MSVALPVVTATVGSAGPLHLPSVTMAVGGASPLRLPKLTFHTGASTLLRLPVLTMTAGGVSPLRLPMLTMTPVLNYSHVPSGGVSVEGAAPIQPADPYVGSGGVTAGGAATVADTYVMLLNWPAYGGTQVSGAATVEMLWIEHVPTGGLSAGGAAIIPNQYRIDASGGLSVGGIAFDGSPFTMTGGVTLGGTAELVASSTFTITPTGGMAAAGSASLSFATPVVASGGVSVGGTATVTDYFPAYVASGGVSVGGEAFSYFLPAGFTATDSNPYNDAFEAWAINYDTSAPSRYVGLPATSMCRFNGVTYMTTRAGVYAYRGDTDDGANIPAAVTTPRTDFEEPHDKKIQAIYVSARASGQLLLKVTSNEVSGRYYALTYTPDYVHGARATLGRGLQSRYWQFRIENRDGAAFDLDGMEFKPQILKRHGV